MSYVDDILMKYYNDDNKYISETNHDTFDDSVEYLSEAEYNKSVKHLRLEVLDVEKFIKNNDKFGAFYLIRNNKLEIYDNNGFIRDADIKREQ